MTAFFFLRCSILFILGLVLYAQTFHHGFVFDDHFYILDNPYLRSFQQLQGIWSTIPFTRAVGVYSLALNYYSGHLDPFGYHVFNFVVHLCAALMVWLLVDLLMKEKRWAFFVALLFLVHPGQTQAVSYISQRFESMAMLFYIAAVYFYMRARLDKEARAWVFYGLTAIFTILALMTKETAITLPLMLLAGEWILLPRTKNHRQYLMLLAIAVLSGILFLSMVHQGFTILFSTNISDSHEGDILTPSNYFLTQMRVFLTFLRLLVFPIYQNLDYDYPASLSLFDPPLTLLGLLAMAGFVFSIIKLRRDKPLIAFGLAWILITFLINLVPRANVIFEHKLYLISFGFFLSAVSGLSLIIKDRQTLRLMLIIWIAVLALATYKRNQVWQDEKTLWQDVIEKSPLKARAYNGLGVALAQDGQLPEALTNFTKAIDLKPDFAEGYNNRGNAYMHEGQDALAMQDLDRAISLRPNYAESYTNRGNIYNRRGDLVLALGDYSQAIVSNPNYFEAYIYRGNLYSSQRQYPKALDDYNKAIEINPNAAGAYYNRGGVYRQLGDSMDAVSDFNKAVSLDPIHFRLYRRH